MTIKQMTLLSAFAFGLAVFCSPLNGQESTQNAVVAKEISKEEAAKKYPPGPKGYLQGMPARSKGASVSQGFYRSPHSNKMYDCREVKPGMFILDTYAKPPQVFVRPP